VTHLFLYPVGQTGFTAVTFLTVLPLTQMMVLRFTTAFSVGVAVGVGVAVTTGAGVGVGVGVGVVGSLTARLTNLISPFE
jgi:hypothetical protein